MVASLLVVSFISMGIAPAGADCSCPLAPIGQDRYSLESAQGHLRSHGCCKGTKTVPLDIEQGCSHHVFQSVRFVVPKVEYPGPVTVAIVSSETPLGEGPFCDLTERDSNLTAAAPVPAYLVNLSLRC